MSIKAGATLIHVQAVLHAHTEQATSETWSAKRSVTVGVEVDYAIPGIQGNRWWGRVPISRHLGLLGLFTEDQFRFCKASVKWLHAPLFEGAGLWDAWRAGSQHQGLNQGAGVGPLGPFETIVSLGAPG